MDRPGRGLGGPGSLQRNKDAKSSGHGSQAAGNKRKSPQHRPRVSRKQVVAWGKQTQPLMPAERQAVIIRRASYQCALANPTSASGAAYNIECNTRVKDNKLPKDSNIIQYLCFGLMSMR